MGSVGGRGNIKGLACFDMIVIPIDNPSWDDPEKASYFEQFITWGKPGSPVFMIGKGELPVTYLFKTREGGIGILQITGFTDEPKGVKIHYKMAKKEPRPPEQFLPTSNFEGKEPENLDIREFEGRKTAIRVDLLVCEVYADKRIDAATCAKVKELIGERIESGGVANLPDKVLRFAVQSEQVPKDKLDSLVCLLGSKGYLKILMNPTLEVLAGRTAKVRSSYKGPTGKEIIDSFEVTPRILDDGCISLETELIIDREALRKGEEETAVETGLRISKKENRIKDGGSLIIGGVTKTEKRDVVRGVPLFKDIPLIGGLFSSRDFEERKKQILAVVTASISEGD